MPEFSLTNVGVLGKRQKRKPPAVAKADAAAAILLVAKIIDPAAWSGEPQPTVEQFQRHIRELTEDIEWLSTVPTTPEGEYQRIRSERRQQSQQRFAGPIQADDRGTQARRDMALEKARRALDAFNGFAQGKRRRPMLIVRAGRKPSWRTI
jgi:hypothetical protein